MLHKPDALRIHLLRQPGTKTEIEFCDRVKMKLAGPITKAKVDHQRNDDEQSHIGKCLEPVPTDKIADGTLISFYESFLCFHTLILGGENTKIHLQHQ